MVERPLLIASDIDGTLLDEEERVGERTRAAIDRVVAAGVPFVLASGRPPRWTPWVAEMAGVRGHAVCCNGAVRYDIGADKVRTAHNVEPELLRSVTARLREAIPAINFAIERVGDSADDPGTIPFLAETGYAHPWPGEHSRAAPLDELTAEPCVKLLARDTTLTSTEMADIARELAGTELAVTYSEGNGLIEFGAPGITKATGLATIAEELGIEPEGVLAFGDMPNDIELLSWAGCGVAMANAHSSVRAVADKVTASNDEDGIAEVLERWF